MGLSAKANQGKNEEEIFHGEFVKISDVTIHAGALPLNISSYSIATAFVRIEKGILKLKAN